MTAEKRFEGLHRVAGAQLGVLLEKAKVLVAGALPPDLFGAMVTIELKNAGKAEVFAFMEKLKMIVCATSLGDVHTMMLYPSMSSHLDISPKHRERMGIRENLVRLSVGIEAPEDVIADLEAKV